MAAEVPSRADRTTLPTQPSLHELIVAGGHHAGPRVTDLSRLATAAQLARYRAGAAETDKVTRTTALWALAHLDADVGEALRRGGIDESRLADVLKLRGVPEPAEVESAVLHEDFADAVRSYLAGRPADDPVDLPDLALAIVQAARSDRSRGLLPRRASKLSADLGAAAGALERLVERRRPAADALNEAAFSGSVLHSRSQLGGGAEVTAAQIAAALQQVHGEYGGGRFGRIRLRLSAGLPAPTDDWLRRVLGLYDLGRVAGSRHAVVDGELLLLGLAELDRPLAEDLRQDGFLDELMATADVLPWGSTKDRTEWTPDAPAERDLLGRMRFAEALADRLRHLAWKDGRRARSYQARSFLVHIDGPWGAGKSSLFVFLRQLLRPEFLVVDINAWREQRMGVQWWTILSALRRAIILDRPWYRRPFARLADLAGRVRAGWVPFATAMLALAAVLIGLLVLAGPDLTTSGEAADSVLKIVSLGSAAFAGLVAATRYLLPGSRKAAQGVVDTAPNPMHEVTRLLARALRRAQKPVVFLIDDLDRCDGDYVVEFLEVVQTLLRDAPLQVPRTRRDWPGPYAFIAADGGWIRSSFENRYESFRHTAVPGRPLGYLFLEKIFQLHARLPAMTPNAREAFLQALLKSPGTDQSDQDVEQKAYESAKAAVGEARSEAQVVKAARLAVDIADPAKRMEVLGNAAVKFSQPDIQQDTEHALAPFSSFLEPNPRTMRLFVNTYGVLRSLRTLEEVFVSSGPLALWTLVEIRWPMLADHLRAHPESVAAAEDAVPEDVRVLLESREVEAVLHDGTAGPLTPDLIRQCSGAP